METLEQLLDSAEFNIFFNAEEEKKEIEQAGWTYEEMTSFGKQLSKKIEKRKG
jgi:hypothetical protein